MAGCVIRGAGKANEQLSGYGDLATAAYQAIGDQGQGQEPKIVFVHHFFLVLYKRAKSGHSPPPTGLPALRISLSGGCFIPLCIMNHCIGYKRIFV
jgi:hypothetical protein